MNDVELNEIADIELPGQWERADFLGGQYDMELEQAEALGDRIVATTEKTYLPIIASLEKTTSAQSETIRRLGNTVMEQSGKIASLELLLLAARAPEHKGRLIVRCWICDEFCPSCTWEHAFKEKHPELWAKREESRK